MTSVFAAFNWSRLELHQSETSLMHLCRCSAIVCFCPWGGDVHLGVVSEAVVVKFMTVEDSVDVFSVRDELLRPED